MKFTISSILTVLAVFLLVSSAQSLDQKQCKCKVKVQQRIFNGHDVDDRKYPWLVSIHSMVLSNNQNLTVCQATILNEQWLLTAASCVPDPKASDESIEDMKVEISKNKPWMDVAKVVLHPEFVQQNSFEAVNDIALVKLTKKIALDGIAEPACLFEEVKSAFTGNLTFAGYGSVTSVLINTETRTVSGFRPSKHLLEGAGFDYSTRSKNEKCGDLLCVSKPKGPSAVCLGDQGTPIHWTPKKDGKNFVVGVATIPNFHKISFKVVELCSQKEPEVLATRVQPYLEWINQVVAKQLCH